MHVLLIPSEHYMTQGYPLGGIFQYHQANALYTAGYKVGVIAPGIISSRFLFKNYKYSEFETIYGYPVYRKYIRKYFPHRWSNPTTLVPIYKKLGMELYNSYKERYGKPDIIHAHNVLYAGVIAQSINNVDQVPYAITEHCSSFMTNNIHKKLVPYIKQVMDQAAVNTAVSPALAFSIKQQINCHDIRILPNLVDEIFFEQPLIKKKTNQKDVIFLNIASLDDNKNQALLIKAFALNYKGKNAVLRIAGAGPLKKRLVQLPRSLSIDKQVVYLGLLDRQSVISEIQSADCLVLSSKKETFGVVLIEALALGIPVISTRSGGPEYIINENNGILVEQGSHVALGEAMANMEQAKNRYMAEVLREECKKFYGKDAFIHNISGLYLKLLNSPSNK